MYMCGNHFEILSVFIMLIVCEQISNYTSNSHDRNEVSGTSKGASQIVYLSNIGNFIHSTLAASLT